MGRGWSHRHHDVRRSGAADVGLGHAVSDVEHGGGRGCAALRGCRGFAGLAQGAARARDGEFLSGLRACLRVRGLGCRRMGEWVDEEYYVTC